MIVYYNMNHNLLIVNAEFKKGDNILTERLKILQNMEMVTINIKVMEEKLDIIRNLDANFACNAQIQYHIPVDYKYQTRKS